MSAGKSPADVRRTGRRLLERLESINLAYPLGAGFHAELCSLARDLSRYKEGST